MTRNLLMLRNVAASLALSAQGLVGLLHADPLSTQCKDILLQQSTERTFQGEETYAYLSLVTEDHWNKAGRDISAKYKVVAAASYKEFQERRDTFFNLTHTTVTEKQAGTILSKYITDKQIEGWVTCLNAPAIAIIEGVGTDDEIVIRVRYTGTPGLAYPVHLRITNAKLVPGGASVWEKRFNTTETKQFNIRRSARDKPILVATTDKGGISAALTISARPGGLSSETRQLLPVFKNRVTDWLKYLELRRESAAEVIGTDGSRANDRVKREVPETYAQRAKKALEDWKRHREDLAKVRVELTRRIPGKRALISEVISDLERSGAQPDAGLNWTSLPSLRRNIKESGEKIDWLFAILETP